MVEYRFTSHVSVEVDGLYRKFRFNTAAVKLDGSLNSVSPSPVVTWQFPTLVKYRFRASKVNPVVELGPSFRATGNLNGTNPSHYGISAGAGMELHARSVTIAPTLRYTHWAPDGVPQYSARSNPNQLELLVKLSRGSEIGAHPWGRRFSLGVIAGAVLKRDLPPTTVPTPIPVPLPGGGSMFQTGITNYTGLTSFIAGPMVELALAGRLSLEIDGLYHPLRYLGETSLNGGTAIRTATFNSAITWEFPVVAKYKFSLGPVKPLVELGPSFRLPQNVVRPLSTHAVTAGAGVELPLGGLKIAPVFRYTRWATDRTGVTRDQLLLLVGFSF